MFFWCSFHSFPSHWFNAFGFQQSFFTLLPSQCVKELDLRWIGLWYMILSACLRHLRVSFPIKAIYKAFKVCCIETHRHKHFWYVLSQNNQNDSLPYHRHIIPTEFKLKFFHLWVGHHKALNRNWQCSRDTFNTDLWQLPSTMSSSGLRRYPVSQPWNITHGFSNVLNLVPWVQENNNTAK